ncbi:MAG: hypothetical protein KGI90_08810 [Burkholderiales bacterium]|nr:hypothetical protein [Burkholderiales bacterium]
MPDVAAPAAESSWILAALSLGLLALAAYVALAWMRIAQRQPLPRRRLPALALAAGVLGTALCAAGVLLPAAEPLLFKLGYRSWAVPALWLGAMAACLPAVAAPLAATGGWGRRARWTGYAAGLWLGAVAAAVQVGWIVAAGLRPGIAWEYELLFAAPVLAGLGGACALRLRFGPGWYPRGPGRAARRVVLGLLLGVGLYAGQQLVVSAADLPTQKESTQWQQASGLTLSLVAGVLVPLALAALAADAALRSEPGSEPLWQLLPRRRRRRRGRA